MKFKLLCLALVLAWGQAAFAQDAEPGREHSIPLFLPEDNMDLQGFIRIINHSDREGMVKIYGVDDAGMRAGPASLSLEPMQTVHLNSSHLEAGAADRALEGSLGDGSGNWRLLLYSDLDIEPLAYMRKRSDPGMGFLNSLHDQAREASMNWRAPIFNPGSNTNQASRLRLINPGSSSVDITITGQDDGGEQGDGSVRFSLGAGMAREISAQELEQEGSGMTGSLGDGAGKWRLNIAATSPIQVMSLMESAGLLSNLSSGRQAYRGATNTWMLSFDGAGASAGYAILAPDSKLRAWLPESDLTRVVSATYTSDGPGAISASGKAYEHGEAALGATGLTGGSEDVSLAATYRSGDWIRGSYTIGGTSRNFTGTAFAGFDRGSGVASLRGEWSTAEGAETPISLSIDNDEGNFTGTVQVSALNCPYSGQFSAANPGFDLYESSAAVNCTVVNLEDVPIMLGIRDAEGEPGGGDVGILLMVLPQQEIGFGAILSRD